MSSPTNNWSRKTIVFLLSQCITLFGSTLVQFAIVWYVTLQTSSGVWVSALTVCAYLPQFLISFVGGVWADRYSRKMLIIASDAAIALFTLALMLLMPQIASGEPLMYALLIVSALRSVGAGIQTPAVNAVLPQLVPEEQLMRYNGINATMQSIVQFAAPAAAGAILTVGTLDKTLLIDIATAAVGIGMLSFVAIPKQAAAAEPASFVDDMKKGVGYAFKHRFLGKLLELYGLFIFLAVPAGFLCSLLVSRVYGDSYYYLTAVELVGFGGMALGGVLMGSWGGFKSRTRTLFWGLAAFGVLAIGMGAAKNFVLYLVLMLIYGIALTMVQTASTTLVQEKAAPEMQGRVFGLMGTMYAGFLPIGMAVFGPMADAVPLQWVMIGSGVGLIVLALFSRLDRSFFDAGAKVGDAPAEN